MVANMLLETGDVLAQDRSRFFSGRLTSSIRGLRNIELFARKIMKFMLFLTLRKSVLPS